MKRQTKIILIVLAVVLVLTTAWSYQYILTRQEAAVAADKNLHDGLLMMDQIVRLGRNPSTETEQEKLAAETTSLITTAAQDAGISPGSIKSFSHESAKRLGDTVYKEKPTRVFLQSITLRQLTDLAAATSLQEAGLNVESIRLSAPPETEAADRWNVELVLTYLVYDPPQTGK